MESATLPLDAMDTDRESSTAATLSSATGSSQECLNEEPDPNQADIHAPSRKRFKCAAGKKGLNSGKLEDEAPEKASKYPPPPPAPADLTELEKVPERPDVNIPRRAYEEQIRLNAESEEIQVKSTEGKLREELNQYLADFDALLTEQVRKFLWKDSFAWSVKKNMRKRSEEMKLKKLEAKRQKKLEIAKARAAEEAKLAAERKKKMEAARKRFSREIDELLKARRSMSNAEKWSDLVDSKVGTGEYIEAFSAQWNNFYAAEIVSITDHRGKSCESIPPESRTAKNKFKVRVHWLGYNRKENETLDIKGSDLAAGAITKQKLIRPWLFGKSERNRFNKAILEKMMLDEKRREKDTHEAAEEAVATEKSSSEEEEEELESSDEDDFGFRLRFGPEFTLLEDFRIQIMSKGGKIREETEEEDPEGGKLCTFCGEGYYKGRLDIECKLLACQDECCGLVFHKRCNAENGVRADSEVCARCKTGKRLCVACGLSNKGEQVSKCSKSDCLECCHLSCSATRDAVTCPHHHCASCKVKTKDSLVSCVRCNRSFHDECLTYGSMMSDDRIWTVCGACTSAGQKLPVSSGKSDGIFVEGLKARQKSREFDFSRFGDHLSQCLLSQEQYSWPVPNAKLVPKTKQRMPKYKHRSTNKYHVSTGPRRNTEEMEVVCRCVDVCDERCDNRHLKIECYRGENKIPGVPVNCRARRCYNQEFTKLEYKKVKPVVAPGLGWGLELREPAKKGDFVIEYVGEVLSRDEAQRRAKVAMEKNKMHVFQMDLGNEQIIDARRYGNLSRFINHSCDANCILQKWTVQGLTKVGIVAKRGIGSGEPLSFDYSFDGGELHFKCLCGADNCRGTFQAVSERSNALRQEIQRVKEQTGSLQSLIAESQGEPLSRGMLKQLVGNFNDMSEEVFRNIEGLENRLFSRVQHETKPARVVAGLSESASAAIRGFSNPPFLARNVELGKQFMMRKRLLKNG